MECYRIGTIYPVLKAGWKWHDALRVLLAGLVGGVVVGALIGFGMDIDTTTTDFVFWVFLPAQNLIHIGAMAFIARTRGFPNLSVALDFRVDPKQIRWVLAGAVLSIPLAWLSGGLRILLGIEEESSQAIVERVIDTRGTATMVAVALGVVVMGPVAEEMIHRGLIFRYLRDRGRSRTFTILITALVFSLIHLMDPSLYNPAGAVTLAVLFVFGIFLGYIRDQNGDLGAPIFVHSGFNLLTLIVLYYFPSATSV